MTPPPSFPMETAEQKIKRICDAVFKEVLQETPRKSMTIPQNTQKVFWRPNNYRRQITLKTKTDSTIKKIRSTINSAKFSRISRLIDIPEYEGIILQYGKEKLTAIHKQQIIAGEKVGYVLEGTIEQIANRITEKVEEIRNRLDNALIRFAKQFNLYIPENKIIWKRHEDEIKGEKFIDSLPEDLIIHDTIFKKVYKKGLEFKGTDTEPGVHVKNYLKNRAIEDIAPEIAEAIVLQDPLRFLKKKIKKPEDTLKYPDIIKYLNEQEKAELTAYLFLGASDF